MMKWSILNQYVSFIIFEAIYERVPWFSKQRSSITCICVKRWRRPFQTNPPPFPILNQPNTCLYLVGCFSNQSISFSLFWTNPILVFFCVFFSNQSTSPFSYFEPTQYLFFFGVFIITNPSPFSLFWTNPILAFFYVRFLWNKSISFSYFEPTQDLSFFGAFCFETNQPSPFSNVETNPLKPIGHFGSYVGDYP